MDEASPARYLTLAQVAELLALDLDDVMALVYHGELRGARLGMQAHWRVEQASVEEYLNERHEDARRVGLWFEANEASFPELWGSQSRS